MKQFLFPISELGDMDYNLLTQTSTFQAGETRACTTISILNDIIAEGTESFTVTLIGNSVVVINNTASTATVVIIDDDGRPTNIMFRQPCVEVK